MDDPRPEESCIRAAAGIGWSSAGDACVAAESEEDQAKAEDGCLDDSRTGTALMQARSFSMFCLEQRETDQPWCQVRMAQLSPKAGCNRCSMLNMCNPLGFAPTAWQHPCKGP